MPVDPQLLNALANPKMPQFDNPMEQYGLMMQNALAMEKLSAGRRERETKAGVRAQYKANTRPDGTMDRNAFRYGLAQNDLGDAIPDADEGFGKLDKLGAETKKLGGEYENAKMGAAKTFEEAFAKHKDNSLVWMRGLSDDPNLGLQQYGDLLDAEAEHPLTVEMARRYGKDPKQMAQQQLEQARQQAAAGQWQKYRLSMTEGTKVANEQVQHVIAEKDGQRLVSAPKYGTEPTQTLANYGPRPVAAGTNVTLVNEAAKAVGAYEQERGVLKARREEHEKDVADNAQDQIDDINYVQDQLKLAITGTGAGAMERLASLAAQLKTPIVGKDVLAATQAVRMALAQTMLVNIGTLREDKGVRLGSVTEREFAQLVASAPSIDDRPEVINAWLERAKGKLQEVQRRFNRHNDSRESNPATKPFTQALPTDNVPSVPAGQAPGAAEDPEAFLRRHGHGGTPTGGRPFPR